MSLETFHFLLTTNYSPFCREQSTITTKKKLTSRGSEYFQTDAVTNKIVTTESGGEEEEVDVFVEKGAKSVSQKESHLEAANAKIVPKVFMSYNYGSGKCVTSEKNLIIVLYLPKAIENL